MVHRQSHRDVLAWPLRLPCLQHEVEAPRPHRFPHSGGSGGGVEELAPVEVEPQLPMVHHPQIALTHRGKDRRDGDDIWGEVLELHPVMVAERPHEAARRSAQAVVVELGERDHIASGWPGLPVVRRRRYPLRPR